jgi:hypothetical protein
MHSSTNSFETEVIEGLGHLLADRYPGLVLEVPGNAGWYTGPQPDFLVANPVSGATIIGELKGGFQAEHLPIAMLPQVRALRDRFAADRPGVGEMIVITTGKIPRLVQQGLERDQIEFFEVASAAEAVSRIADRLTSL